MLASQSQDMTESALLDWEYIGHGFQLNDGEVGQLLALTRDPEKPINLRLAILRAMSRRSLASEEAWAYLFKHEENENLLQVLKSTQGYESRAFMDCIITLLDHPSGSLAEGAARALGHPAYAGAEPSLKPLLNSENLRLNYAAVWALLGINSQQARDVLQNAAANHPNAKVRRMISARMNVVT
jgi:HEAT repeat protein